jgi:hypothetical protein
MSTEEYLREQLNKEFFEEIILPQMEDAGFSYKNNVFVYTNPTGLKDNGVRTRTIKAVYKGKKVQSTFNVKRYISKVTNKEMTAQLLPFQKNAILNNEYFDEVKTIYLYAKQKGNTISYRKMHLVFIGLYKKNIPFSTFYSLMKKLERSDISDE